MMTTHATEPIRSATDFPRRVLHVLDHSQPHRSGYAIRSDSILRFQRRLGFEPVVLTSPKHGPSNLSDMIGDVTYHRTDPTAHGLTGQLRRVPLLREQRLMRVMTRRITEVARTEAVDVIHAHSPSLNGIPAVTAAHRLGLPVVYEVRAFWEDAAVDHGTFTEDSLRYRLSRQVETRVFHKAGAITVICQGIRDELVARGVAREKITIIPNGVDLERFAPRPASPELIERYGLRDRIVLAFLGSFYRYEGLPLLIKGFAQLRATNPEARLLLVGGGEEEAEVRVMIGSMGLGDSVIVTGSVPPEQVLDFYSVADMLVYPRHSMRLTDRVTPLKPLEAMAMGKLVVASDVGGMKELIHDGETGLLFPAGDVDALARTLRQAIVDRDRWAAMGERARRHVTTTRDWPEIVARYRSVYEQARDAVSQPLR